MQPEFRPLICRSPAKINLFLHVLGRRSDGYHDIETLFQFLQFHDTLTFQPTRTPGLERIDSHDFTLPATDLIIRAAQLLQTRCATANRRGMRITLNKVIPPGSGLGGGSSNAATTLLALNQLWRLGLSRHRLMVLAGELGADVPLFIYGHSCWATGRGDRFERYNPEESWYCIALPDTPISTAQIFAAPELRRDANPIIGRRFDFHTTYNALQPVVEKRYPEVARAINVLTEFGTLRMSGSGGAVFLRCDSRQRAEYVRAQVNASVRCIVTRTVNQILDIRH